jgi:hypothetical protein
MPSEYGVQRPLYFFLLPSYWREGLSSVGPQLGHSGGPVDRGDSLVATDVYSENPMVPENNMAKSATGKMYPAEQVDRHVVSKVKKTHT